MDESEKILLSEIALALNDHSAALNDAMHFVDLTTGQTSFFMSEVMNDYEEDDTDAYPDWEKGMAKEYRTHELIEIEPISSSESFRVMETFAQTRSEKEQQFLYKALNRKHPFSNFKYACESLGILKQWYSFKDESDLDMAQEWLKDNDLEIKDGKVQRIK